MKIAIAAISMSIICAPVIASDASAKYAVQSTVPVPEDIASLMTEIVPNSPAVNQFFVLKKPIAFENWAEARYVADCFERSSGLTFKVEPQPASTEHITLRDAGLPVYPELSAGIKSLPDIPIDEKQTSEVEAMLKTVTPSEAQITLNALLKIHSSKDEPFRAWLLVKRGINSLRVYRLNDALEDFEEVVKNDTVATRLDKVKALRRVAWVEHSKGNKILAYAVYDQLENFSQSGLTTATARLEKCGITMELVRSAKGFWPDCEDSLKTALSEMDPVYERQRGTLDLMLLESQYYQEKYQSAMDMASKWLEKYPSSLRDKYMCLNFAAMAAHKQDNWPLAKKFFTDLLQLPNPTSPQEKFGSEGKVWDMKKRALQQLITLAEKHSPDEVDYFKRSLDEYEESVSEKRASR